MFLIDLKQNRHQTDLSVFSFFVCYQLTYLEWIDQSTCVHGFWYSNTSSCRWTIFIFVHEIGKLVVSLSKRSLFSPNTLQLLVYNWETQHWRTRWLFVRELNVNWQRTRRLLLHFIQIRPLWNPLFFIQSLNAKLKTQMLNKLMILWTFIEQ